MNTILKIGGIAAITLGGFFVLLVLVLMYLPSIGLGPGTLNDPKIGVGFMESSAIPSWIALLYLGIGIATMIALSASARTFSVNDSALADWATLTAAVAGTLFISYAMSDLVALPYAVTAFHTDPVLGGAAYVAIRAVGHCLSAGGLFATGLGVAILGLAGLRGGVFPKALSLLMILAGLSAGLSFLILPLGLIGLLLAPVWSLWLGVVMLRQPTFAVVRRPRRFGRLDS